MRIEGKVAVVTGSGRDIGRACARALAEAGCAVVITEAAERLVRRAVDSFGGIDIMCTNAGILRDRVL